MHRTDRPADGNSASDRGERAASWAYARWRRAQMLSELSVVGATDEQVRPAQRWAQQLTFEEQRRELDHLTRGWQL